MSHPSDIISLDHFQADVISNWLDTANLLFEGKFSPTNEFSGKLLCPIFMQKSTHAYIHATSNFGKLGGTALPLNTYWMMSEEGLAEPTQDVSTLINSSCDYVIFRSNRRSDLYEFRDWCDLPLINAGCGIGTGTEHPMQALVDLFTMTKEFGKKSLNILMVGSEYLCTTRSQVKLFLKFGHKITLLSPESTVINEDIEEIYRRACARVYDIRDVDLSPYDVIYQNGLDGQSSEALINIAEVNEYRITRYLLDKNRFNGKVMHSLPRKTELSRSVDETPYNAYFTQMEMAKYMYQSMFLHQKYGLLNSVYSTDASSPKQKVH